jgi:hypothetical protein
MPKWFAVQKGTFQIVGAWSLDRILHGVFGQKGMKAFAQQAAATITELHNDVDNYFDGGYPNKPVVINKENISGCTDTHLLQAFGFANIPGLVQLCYKRQVQLIFGSFLSKHPDEFISFAAMDGRNALSLHAGPSPRDGTRWIRVNGRGIAKPGLQKNTLEVSKEMRKEMGQICLFLVEILLRKMVTGTQREHECVSDEYRHSLNDL